MTNEIESIRAGDGKNLEAPDADWYHVECDDPDLSQFFDNWADAGTLVDAHGGTITALFAGPMPADAERVMEITRTLCNLVRTMQAPRTKQAQAPYEAALLLASQLEASDAVYVPLVSDEIAAPATGDAA